MNKPLVFEIDIEGNLRNYLPSIFQLLDDNKINWRRVSKQYQKEYERRREKLLRLKDDEIIVEACLFDIISQLLLGRMQYYNLLKFFDELFSNLAEKTSQEEKKLLKSTVYNLMINVDKNYLNFIGEFAVLNNLKNYGYTLLATEYPLTEKGKKSNSVDFVVQMEDKTRLIEVVNIHLPDADQLYDKEIEKAVTQKIRHKLNEKGRNSKYPFILAPVLWGGYEALKLINEYYEKNEFSFENVLFPAAYQSYIRKDAKEASFIFGSIKKLILV